MSFSQSLLFGDDTLDLLDVCGSEHAPPTEHKTNTNTANAAEISRNGAPSKMRPPNQMYIGSPDPREPHTHRTVLDVIDESPTDKKEVNLGKSIRERLKNVSTSKKHHRKHLRRSKSDPLTADESSINRTRQDKSSMLADDLDAALDSSDEWNVQLTSFKSKSKLCDKFGDDSMDSFLKNIQTQPSLNNTKELIAISSSDEDVLVSEIERMLNGSDNMSNVTFNVPLESAALSAEQSSSIGSQSNVKPSETSLLELVVESSFQWEESAFFNNLNASNNDLSQVNDQNDNIEMKTNVDILVDADCNLSVQHVDHVNEAELESCYLEISVELSKLNETHQQSQATPQLVNTSRRISVPTAKTQPTNERAESNSCTPPKSQASARDIHSLTQWGCTSAIIREYLKRGVRSMFEWQQECLSKSEVICNVSHTFL